MFVISSWRGCTTRSGATPVDIACPGIHFRAACFEKRSHQGLAQTAIGTCDQGRRSADHHLVFDPRCVKERITLSLWRRSVRRIAAWRPVAVPASSTHVAPGVELLVRNLVDARTGRPSRLPPPSSSAPPTAAVTEHAGRRLFLVPGSRQAQSGRRLSPVRSRRLSFKPPPNTVAPLGPRSWGLLWPEIRHRHADAYVLQGQG